jgi:hypothetical protein
LYKISDSAANPSPKPPCIIRNIQPIIQQSGTPFKQVFFGDVTPLDKKRKLIMRAVELDIENSQLKEGKKETGSQRDS